MPLRSKAIQDILVKEVDKSKLADHLTEILATLTQRQEEVLRLRFGLGKKE